MAGRMRQIINDGTGQGGWDRVERMGRGKEDGTW